MRQSSIIRLLWVAAFFVASEQAQANVITISSSLNQLQPGVDNQGWVSATLGNNNARNEAASSRLAAGLTMARPFQLLVKNLAIVPRTSHNSSCWSPDLQSPNPDLLLSGLLVSLPYGL